MKRSHSPAWWLLTHPWNNTHEWRLPWYPCGRFRRGQTKRYPLLHHDISRQRPSQMKLIFLYKRSALNLVEVWNEIRAQISSVQGNPKLLAFRSCATYRMSSIIQELIFRDLLRHISMSRKSSGCRTVGNAIFAKGSIRMGSSNVVKVAASMWGVQAAQSSTNRADLQLIPSWWVWVSSYICVILNVGATRVYPKPVLGRWWNLLGWTIKLKWIIMVRIFPRHWLSTLWHWFRV